MKKIFKKIVFAIIVVALIAGIGFLVKTGKFTKLEGYMYSFASEITGGATDCDATSCDATSGNATSDNATSGNATSCDATSCDATSSNATSCDATSCDATSSNATSSNILKVTNNVKSEPVKTTTQIEEETEKDLEYKNSEITKDVIENIRKTEESINIIITTDTNKIISKELFDVIKGTDRQLTIKTGDNQIIFNGKDITNIKDIDVTVSYNLIKNDTMLNAIGQDGVVVNFANNGELPGAATVRIKVTDEMKKVLSFNTIYVYYYNEANKELIQMNNNAIYKNGFIEFVINHNSKYIFVNNEITEDDITTKVDDSVTFLESNKVYVIIIIIAVFTVVFVIVILIVDKKTKGKAYKQK